MKIAEGFSPETVEEFTTKIDTKICKSCGRIYFYDLPNLNECWFECGSNNFISIPLAMGTFLMGVVMVSKQAHIEFVMRQLKMLTAKDQIPYVRCDNVTLEMMQQFIENHFYSHQQFEKEEETVE